MCGAYSSGATHPCHVGPTRHANMYMPWCVAPLAQAPHSEVWCRSHSCHTKDLVNSNSFRFRAIVSTKGHFYQNRPTGHEYLHFCVPTPQAMCQVICLHVIKVLLLPPTSELQTSMSLSHESTSWAPHRESLTHVQFARLSFPRKVEVNSHERQ
jgi:hypothetical protein